MCRKANRSQKRCATYKACLPTYTHNIPNQNLVSIVVIFISRLINSFVHIIHINIRYFRYKYIDTWRDVTITARVTCEWNTYTHAFKRSFVSDELHYIIKFMTFVNVAEWPDKRVDFSTLVPPLLTCFRTLQHDWCPMMAMKLFYWREYDVMNSVIKYHAQRTKRAFMHFVDDAGLNHITKTYLLKNIENFS